jgi:hypothetical protein
MTAAVKERKSDSGYSQGLINPGRVHWYTKSPIVAAR